MNWQSNKRVSDYIMTIIYHLLLKNIIVWIKKNVYLVYECQQVATFNKNIDLMNLK